MIANKRGASSHSPGVQPRSKKVMTSSRKRAMKVVNSDAEGELQRKVLRSNVFVKAKNIDLTGTHFQKLRILSIVLNCRVLPRMMNSGQCTQKLVRSTRKKGVKMNLASRMLRSITFAP